jgi:hypothetical protein
MRALVSKVAKGLSTELRAASLAMERLVPIDSGVIVQNGPSTKDLGRYDVGDRPGRRSVGNVIRVGRVFPGTHGEGHR